MIPQRTLSGECEITTGAFSITKRPPVYTGESAALNVQVSFKFQGVDYVLPSGVVAEMYLRYPNTDLMTVAVEMEKSGNTASGVLSAEQTGVAGYPLLVIQLTDTETASLIVACATTVKVSNVRGNLVVDTRAPTPSEIVYVGRSPYIDPTTKHWITWDSEQAKYVDTGINAEGVIGFTPDISIGTVQSVPTGESAEVTRTGTDENPVFNFKLPRSGDGVGIYPVSIPIAVAEWVSSSGTYKYTFSDATIKAYMTVLESWLDDESVQIGKVWYTVNDGSLVVNTDVVPTAAWALHVTLGTDGTDVLEDVDSIAEDVADLQDMFPVSVENGGTGGTTAAAARQALGITGENIPTSVISGKTNVDGALGLLSQQIDDLQAADAYVENGDTAQLRTYAAGDFIMWKGVLYTVNSEGITQGTAITGHVKEVTEGGFNALNNGFNNKFDNLKYSIGGITNGSSETFNNIPNGAFIILHNGSRNAIILIENNNVAVLVQSNMENNVYSRNGTSITITNGSDRFVYADVVIL